MLKLNCSLWSNFKTSRKILGFERRIIWLAEDEFWSGELIWWIPRLAEPPDPESGRYWLLFSYGVKLCSNCTMFWTKFSMNLFLTVGAEKAEALTLAYSIKHLSAKQQILMSLSTLCISWAEWKFVFKINLKLRSPVFETNPCFWIEDTPSCPSWMTISLSLPIVTFTTWKRTLTDCGYSTYRLHCWGS